MMNLMQENVPELTRSCPWEGRFEIINSKMNKKFISFLPKGVYRIDLTLSGEGTKSSLSILTKIEIY